MACNDEWCKSPLDESGAVMNNAGCCSVPGHWTHLSACPSLISKHTLKKNNNIIITMITPLSLCTITLLLFPSTHSLLLFPVIHFISSLCLCPRLIASSLLSACLPSLFPCESIRKLFTVIFLRLLLLPAPHCPDANEQMLGWLAVSHGGCHGEYFSPLSPTDIVARLCCLHGLEKAWHNKGVAIWKCVAVERTRLFASCHLYTVFAVCPFAWCRHPPRSEGNIWLFQGKMCILGRTQFFQKNVRSCN